MTNAVRPYGSTAVMNRRVEPPDSLDYFPTPPWATRAFLPVLQRLDPDINQAVIWEPASGGGHMAAVLAELSGRVFESDVFDYGRGVQCLDFLNPQLSDLPGLPVDWVITNPPFNVAEDFAKLGLQRARTGVALLVRLGWLDTEGRCERLFKVQPPRLILQYAERVPMHRGRWEPNGSTATAYCWVVWLVDHTGPTEFNWIPPGRKAALSRPEDLRFAVQADAPLFEESNP